MEIVKNILKFPIPSFRGLPTLPEVYLQKFTPENKKIYAKRQRQLYFTATSLDSRDCF